MELQEHFLELIRTVTADFKDTRVYAEKHLRSTVFFLDYLMMNATQSELDFTGCNIRPVWKGFRMTVKVVRDGTPLVAFVTERTPMGCMLTFCRMWFGERVKWVDDKYPVI